jgi:hypothetical protein
MSNGNKFKVTMLFPIYDNEGMPFEAETYNWFADQIQGIFPEGVTEYGGLASGWWHGKQDLSRCIWAIVGESELNGIKEFLREAKGKFAQEKMYFEYHSTTYEEVG